MAIPSKKGLVAQFHWLKGSALVNINGGHSEGYIRNAGLGSVPKIANCLFFACSLFPTLQEESFCSKALLLIAYRLVCFTLLIAFQVLSIKSQGGLRL